MSDAATHYQESYGAWAGDRAGRPPDLKKCCAAVWTRDRWPREFQCSKPRGHGPDGAYCKQHDPEVIAARNKASQARDAEKFNARRYEWHGRTFFDALEKIAAGHNDARGLAQKVIDNFKSGERK